MKNPLPVAGPPTEALKQNLYDVAKYNFNEALKIEPEDAEAKKQIKAIDDANLQGTVLNLVNLDQSVISVDLNTLVLDGPSLISGITTHNFLKITENSFSGNTYNGVFVNSFSK